MNNLVWMKGQRALEGEFQTSSGVSFYIDEVLIDIIDRIDRCFLSFGNMKYGKTLALFSTNRI